MGLWNKPEETKITKQLEIINKLGMHARPCSKFVKLAHQYKADVWVEKDGEMVSGKSIMGLMTLASGEGSVISVTCDGSDAVEALAALEKLVAAKFDEE